MSTFKTTQVKIAVVGDANIGKTCLLMSYMGNTTPSIFNSIQIQKDVKIRNAIERLTLILCDTGSSNEYTQYRAKSYTNVDIILVSFDVSNIRSLQSIDTKWIQEIQKYAPNAIFILVGLKSDTKTQHKIPMDIINQYLHKYNFINFIQTSALKKINIDKAFEVGIAKFVSLRKQQRKPLKPIQMLSDYPKAPVINDISNIVGTHQQQWSEHLSTCSSPMISMGFDSPSPQCAGDMFLFDVHGYNKGYNKQIVDQLVNWGYNRNDCIKASLSVINPNDINDVQQKLETDLQNAYNWTESNIPINTTYNMQHNNATKNMIDTIMEDDKHLQRSEIDRLKSELESKNDKIKKLEQEIQELRKLKEQYQFPYYEKPNRSERPTIVMLNQLHAENKQNKNNIYKLTESHEHMIHNFDETKQIFTKSIKSLNNKVYNMEQFVKQFVHKRSVTMAEMNNKLNQNLQLQQQIYKICSDKYYELFYKTIARNVSMMFFDAKAVISDSVKHEISCKSKVGQAIDIGSKIVEKLAQDIPFVSCIIGLVRSAIKVGINVFVLETMAKYVLEFESLFGGNGSEFAAQIALQITKLSMNKINNIKNSGKQINNKIEKLAKEYSDNLSKIISTGYGKNVYMKCINSYLNVLAMLTINHPKKNMNWKQKEYQLQQILDSIESDDAMELVTFYSTKFGNHEFMKNMVEGGIEISQQ
eukprot:179946_1